MSLAQRSTDTRGNSASFIPTAVESLTMQSNALASIANRLDDEFDDAVKLIPVSYTHLTLPTNREV